MHRPKKIGYTTFSNILLFIIILLTSALLASLLGSLHPFFDSLSDIRVHLALFTIFLAVLLILLPQRRQQAIIAIIFSLSMISVSFQNGGLSPRELKNGNPVYKLLQANLRFDNKTQEKLLALIAKEKPDIVTVQEASQSWQAFFALHGWSIFGCLPTHDLVGATGILLSHDFLTRFQTILPDDATCYQASTTRGYLAKLSLTSEGGNETSFNIVSAHLSWPWPFGQNRQLAELEDGRLHAALLQKKGPIIIAGDFNSVTWSNTVNRMERITGTRHISGIGPTWLSYKFPDIFRSYLGLPIDQVLLSPDLRLLAVKRLPSIGSDHLPVLVEFQFQNDRN